MLSTNFVIKNLVTTAKISSSQTDLQMAQFQWNICVLAIIFAFHPWFIEVTVTQDSETDLDTLFLYVNSDE